MDLFSYKFQNLHQPFVIENQEVYPGETSIIKMSVGRLPSDTRIFITAHVYRSVNPGPTILLLAGVHGDEINGIVTLRGMLENENFESIKKGNIIVIPLLNVFGFINFSREVPDGKDVNRSFPGNAQGSLASRVASLITKKILPLIDIAVDLHTGGASRYNYPQIRYAAKDEYSGIIAKAFGAPFTIHKATIVHSFRKVCSDLGIPAIVFEGGESIRLDGYAIEKAKDGIMRLLHHLEILDKVNHVNSEREILVNKTSWIRAPYSGIFIWSKKSGVKVQKNESIGTIKDPYGVRSINVVSKKSGYIIGHNNAAVVNQGDALFHLAYDYEYL